MDFFTSFDNADEGCGCGYHNVQMMLSAVLHAEPALELFCGATSSEGGGAARVPSILTLQRWLEFAWVPGFDVAGAAQLDGIVGGKTWIGATEAVRLLRHQGLKARVVDVVWKGVSKPTNQIGNALFEFARRSGETRLPLFLQWRGHSVTVVGVEKCGTGSGALLALDPGSSREYLSSRELRVTAPGMKRFSVSFKAKEYQFVYPDTAALASNEEREQGRWYTPHPSRCFGLQSRRTLNRRVYT